MEKSRKELFCKKIYEELSDFKKSMLRSSKEDILGKSYKTEVFINLYEILIEKADSFSDTLLINLLNQSTGILDSLYQDFLRKEDVFYDDLKEHIESEFEHGEYNWWDNPDYVEMKDYENCVEGA